MAFRTESEIRNRLDSYELINPGQPGPAMDLAPSPRTTSLYAGVGRKSCAGSTPA
ncbi:hypothetical protein Caci_3959 [Catenulispora acidiphila DSM 44928]|uniref:Uncharacterized protein n=1 Tax=Catenulispora acidiphila (strain DSM 44928 / JCM 14897 / NBRC 102108 / NRRL B-24433 / ID139908) TaxID=479433 RepID=C7QES0_CATAD|nr:hypothetical protein Caci_3959 [Catenulispora acidiphila DSM 44928]